MEAQPLLALMTRQAEDERQAILDQAKAKAEEILDKARARHAAREAEILEAVEGELRVAEERERGRVEGETAMVLKTTKDAVAGEVLDAVRAELARIAAGPDFPDILEALLAELVDGAPEGDLVVLAPPQHADRCKAWLDAKGHSRFKVEPAREMTDGVAIQDQTRTFRTTNALESRLNRREGEMRKRCLQTLFGGEG